MKEIIHSISFSLVCLLLLCSSRTTEARTWKQLRPYHNANPRDTDRSSRYERDPFFFNDPPSPAPSRRPTESPALLKPPSATRRPTRAPMASPGEPTIFSPASTETSYPANNPPLLPPLDYFNYDVKDTARYGPGHPAYVRGPDGFKIQHINNAWGNVGFPTDSYWREFMSNGSGPWNGNLAGRSMHQNMCGIGEEQSPIDIRLSGVACVEHHQIRTRPGDFRLSGESVEKRIESNKLRLLYPRRPCADLMDPICAEPDPPHADFPNGWGGFADILHVDFKLPAEHRIYGEKFDAEMQIFGLHPGRRRLPAISVLIRAEEGAYNLYLQTAIDAFQFEYDLNRAKCLGRNRRERQLMSDFHSKMVEDDQSKIESKNNDAYYETWGDYSTQLDDPTFVKEEQEHGRRLSSIWNPFDEALIPTYWFYGYDGSLTEPPCTEIVSWFIMDSPMLIAPSQLKQMKDILFTNIDGNCQPTSVQSNESVARPIQLPNGRQVWRCSRDDFAPDGEK